MTEQDASINHDCISRGYLLGIANKDGAYGYVSAREIINAPCYKVKESKTGHWIRTGTDVYYDLPSYECDKCGQYSLENGKYCPNCGAKMQEIEK